MEIKNLIPAEPGWQVEIQHQYYADGEWENGGDLIIADVIMWATVRKHVEFDIYEESIDPVFFQGCMMTKSEYHRMFLVPKEERVLIEITRKGSMMQPMLT